MKFMKTFLSLVFSLVIFSSLNAQADNEIQVYASPTIGNKRTIVELHSNYTFTGPKTLADAKTARWLNETVEITHGFAENFEIGLYTFTALDPNGKFQYLGSQIRPRITAPQSWKWPLGVSLSAEFGFFRPDYSSPYVWGGEIRPIFDDTWGNWYVSLNPNIDFVFSGNDKGWNFAPQLKTQYSIQNKWGIGFEYYSALGGSNGFLPGSMQEHLVGPMIDYLANPDWELNTGFLFGLTPNSNQVVFKVLVGRRFGGSK